MYLAFNHIFLHDITTANILKTQKWRNKKRAAMDPKVLSEEVCPNKMIFKMPFVAVDKCLY
jgi:hypothetical protein